MVSAGNKNLPPRTFPPHYTYTNPAPAPRPPQETQALAPLCSAVQTQNTLGIMLSLFMPGLRLDRHAVKLQWNDGAAAFGLACLPALLGPGLPASWAAGRHAPGLGSPPLGCLYFTPIGPKRASYLAPSGPTPLP